MRIPYSKVYRAFPELDAFTDGECEGFVQLAQRERAAGLMGTAMVAVIASLAVGAGAAWGAYGALSAIFGEPEKGTRGDFATAAYFAVSAGAGLISLALTGLAIRDAWLRSTITHRLRTARCPRCSYSLLGLNVIDDRVRCPECGASVGLSERGLTPADILAGARGVVMKGGGA